MNILIDINTCIPSLDLNKFLFPILLVRCYPGSTQRVRPPSPARLSPWWVGPRSAETVRTNTTYKPSWTPMLSLTNSTSWTHARLSMHWQIWYVMPDEKHTFLLFFLYFCSIFWYWVNFSSSCGKLSACFKEKIKHKKTLTCPYLIHVYILLRTCV